jgi:hypothetical protein
MSEERKAYDVISSIVEELVNLYNNEYYIDIEPCYINIFSDGTVSFAIIVADDDDMENDTEDKEILIMSCKFYAMNECSLENALAKHFKKKITIGKKEKSAWKKKQEKYDER